MEKIVLCEGKNDSLFLKWLLEKKANIEKNKIDVFNSKDRDSEGAINDQGRLIRKFSAVGTEKSTMSLSNQKEANRKSLTAHFL